MVSEGTQFVAVYLPYFQLVTIDESFPCADCAFRYAFSMSNPIPKLLELIRAHPNVRTITDLGSLSKWILPSSIDSRDYCRRL